MTDRGKKSNVTTGDGFWQLKAVVLLQSQRRNFEICGHGIGL